MEPEERIWLSVKNVHSVITHCLSIIIDYIQCHIYEVISLLVISLELGHSLKEWMGRFSNMLWAEGKEHFNLILIVTFIILVKIRLS